MDWSDLHKLGKNRFLLIIISLAWWGKVLAQDGSWLEIVVDVTEVLLCMQKAFRGFNGLKENLLGGSGSADSANPSKCVCRGSAAGLKRHKAG